MIQLGVVIPFYNGYQYLDSLLNSINTAASKITCKVFIIDNSSDGKDIIIPKSLNIHIDIIKEKEGIGFGKACNTGYKLCCEEGLDYMIISNQDGYFSESTIDSLILPFITDNTIQITAPLLLKYNSDKIEEFFVQYYLANVPELISDMLNKKLKNFYPIEKISGACLAFNLKNELYKYNYLFDPLFHMYYEDEDLCRRINITGAKIVLISQGAIFYHQHSHTTDKENEEKIIANKLYSFKVLRLKDTGKPVFKILYGIFTTTCSEILFYILRIRLKSFYFEMRSFFLMILKLPAIIRSRKKDIIIKRRFI